MRVLSYSGGVQSTALLVMAATGQYPIDAAIHVDLGLAESPDTLRYVATVALPYARNAGIDVRVVHVNAIDDLLRHPSHPKPPFRSTSSSAPITRQCTNHWKIRPFRRELRALMRAKGLSVRRNTVDVVLGISYDEITRIKQPNVQYYRHVYPLVDRRLTRGDCLDIIASAGLPVPDKSACWFCPFTPVSRAHRILSQSSDLAGLANHLQSVISAARHRHGLPDLEIIPLQSVYLDDDECTGYCLL